jgi:hypothetical protein
MSRPGGGGMASHAGCLHHSPWQLLTAHHALQGRLQPTACPTCTTRLLPTPVRPACHKTGVGTKCQRDIVCRMHAQGADNIQHMMTVKWNGSLTLTYCAAVGYVWQQAACAQHGDTRLDVRLEMSGQLRRSSPVSISLNPPSLPPCSELALPRDPHVLSVGGGPIPRPPHACHEAAQPLGPHPA